MNHASDVSIVTHSDFTLETRANKPLSLSPYDEGAKRQSGISLQVNNERAHEEDWKVRFESQYKFMHIKCD